MNTEATQDNSAPHSTGERLRLARENMGLSQQHVAERLCLKLSTIREIEENKSPADLASTFLRGYIRSYARLVHVPEEELLPMMEKHTPMRTAKIEPMQNFSLGKRRKKRDGWLMIFTWLVIFVVIGLTGAWWWQNHKASQDDLVSMADNNGSNSDNSQSITLDHGDNSTSDAAPAAPDETNGTTAPAETAAPAAVANAQPANPTAPAAMNGAAEAASAPADNSAAKPAETPARADVAANSLPTSAAAVTESAATSGVAIGFKADCWLEVSDATGKKLFSGIQRSGAKLNLSGKAPYHLKIGAPRAVEVQYQNQPVDLSRFIRNNQVARLTLGAQ